MGTDDNYYVEKKNNLNDLLILIETTGCSVFWFSERRIIKNKIIYNNIL